MDFDSANSPQRIPTVLRRATTAVFAVLLLLLGGVYVPRSFDAFGQDADPTAEVTPEPTPYYEFEPLPPLEGEEEPLEDLESLPINDPAVSGPEKNEVVLHDLRVTVDPAVRRIFVEDVLQVRIQDRRKGSISLLLNPKLEIRRVVGEERGKILIHPPEEGRPFNRIEIPLLETGNDRVRYSIEYSGEIYDPVKPSEDIGYVAGDQTAGLIGPEGVYLPADGHYFPYHEDSLPLFNVEVSITEPYLAVTQGKLEWRKTEGNRNISRWVGEAPAEGLTLVAGKYRVHTESVDGIDVSTYFLTDRPDLFKQYLDKLAEYLRLYREVLGPYPYSRFDVVENFFESGYGFPAFTLLGKGVFARGEMALQPGYLDHELVHSWWGNYVFADPDQGNWVEGLTSYFANYYYKERVLGREETVSHRRRIDQKFTVRVHADNDYPLKDFQEKKSDYEDDIGYGKGSMVFHMFRRLIGDPAFFEGFRQFAAQYGGKRAGWKEIQGFLEKKTGQRFGWFFSQWLDRVGGPTIRIEAAGIRPDIGGFELQADIVQEGDPFVLEVPVRVHFASGESLDLTVPSRERLTQFKNRVDRFPVSLELDPDYDLFRVLSIDEVPPSLNATLAEPGHAILLPADGEAFSAPHYQEVAKRAERQKEGMILEKGEEIPHRSLLVLGSARLEPAVKEILGRALPEGIVLEQESFSVHGTVYDKPTQSFLLSIRHPDDPNRTVTLYFGLSPEAVARAHSIFFYGWDSYVVFDEGVPVARGEFYPDEKQTRREVAGRVAEGIDLGRIMGHLSNLASDRLRGRFPDTFGSELAKQYIETEFQKAGLAPVFGETGQPSFRQMFSMWLRDLRAGTFLFTGETGIGGGSVIPFSFSAQGNFTLEPVFAGFGLVREGYDDYGNLNVRGKAVLVLDGHPEFLPVESGGAQLVVEKVKTAMDRGASAVLVLQSGTMDADLDPYLTYPSRLPESFRQKLTGSETEDQIFMKIRQRYSMAPGLSADPAIPVGLIEVDKHSIPGLTPSQIVQEVNQTRTPPGREYPGATMNVTVQFRERKISGENVAGLLEGIDPELKNEVVVVGAHFDHLGVDSAENIYHGADDNASGVAALLEAASAFQNWKSGVKRSLLFVAFDAEEWGLYGSRYFVAHFPLPNRRMAAMLNADAIGRGTDGSVYLIGETMYPKLADHARGVMEGLGLNPGENIDPFAYRHGSDHYSFHEKGIPALMFYSSDYGEMNSLNDTVDKILPDNLQRITKLLFLSALSLVSWGEGLDLGTVPEVESPAGPEDETSVQPVAGEVRLKNVRQLTFGGENAEAYFSSDGARLVFQSKRDGMGCDQIFVMEKDGSGQRMVSTGKGATTCSYFVGNDSKILYSSTHAWGEECPERPPFKGGYAWPVFPSYDIYLANADGSDPKRITESEGYDAEATVSPDGKTIVFTSMRDGDLDIYTMDLEGGNVRRLTEEVGYDGGAFFSPDGTKIVYRAHHPKEPEEILDYRELLAQHLVRPGTLEIFVMDADGSNKTQVTRNGAANFAPFFHPDGRRIVFSSNMEDPAKRNFDLYLIHVDGTGLERVTFNPTFDGFPMFSPDGTQLVFASNRNNRAEGETNIFLADWVENPGEENSPAEIETETDD